MYQNFRSFHFMGLATFASLLIFSSLLPAQEKKEDAWKATIDKVKPAIVYIREPDKMGKGKEKVDRAKYAAGVIIDPMGTVVTNHSLIKELKKIEVVLSDGRVFPAKSVKTDADLDLALIKIEDDKPLPHVEVGDSEKVKVADFVLVVNAPWASEVDAPLAVIVGQIGGKGRWTKMGESMFLVDTTLGPGVGLGPLLSQEGTFIGLVVSRKNPNHAITSNRVKERVAEWSKEK